MKSEEISMYIFLKTDKWYFKVPIYQRKYSWTRKNCIRLYDDLIKISKDQLEKHFFGSVVFSSDGGVAKQTKLIIDGQQRMTTICLLMLAIRDNMNDCDSDNCKHPDPKSLKEAIDSVLLFEGGGERSTKLCLCEEDSETLSDLVFSAKPIRNSDSQLKTNYEYFKNRIRNREISIDELFEAIKKLEIIALELEPKGGDNAQQIFDSINSTGMPLTVGDRIRNYVLMGLDDKAQNRLYQIWKQIEECTTYEKVDEFIKFFLDIVGRGAAKTADERESEKDARVSDKAGSVYTSFRRYAEDGRDIDPGIDLSKNHHRMNSPEYVESLLNELLKFAKYYEILRTKKCGFDTKQNEMDYCLLRLSKLGRVTTYPFFMKILEYHEEKVLDDNEVLEIFELTESFLVRKTICGESSKGDNKLFASLDKTITDCKGEPHDYLSRFKYVITHMESFRFPDDDEFETKIITRDDFYNSNRDVTLYMLERYEHLHLDSKEQFDNLYFLIKKNNWSVEHIMPQTPYPEKWPNLDYENKTYRQYCHKIGNLSLSGHNSSLSNESFETKCFDEEIGYAKSGLYLNRDIADHYYKTYDGKWGPDSIEERTKNMALEAVEIWKYPDASEFQVTNNNIYTLDCDVDFFGGRKLSHYTLRFPNNTYDISCTVWSQMYKDVICFLHKKDPTALAHVAQHLGEYPDLELRVSTNEEDMNIGAKKNGKKGADKKVKHFECGGYYIQVPVGNSSILSALQDFFELYHLDYKVLEFEIGEGRIQRSRNDKGRLEEIFDVLLKWAESKAANGDIVFDSKFSSSSNDAFRFVRFTTNTMTGILPIQDNDDDWGSKNHYFYEIYNGSGREVYIQLAMNPVSASDEFNTACKWINKFANRRNRNNPVWMHPLKNTDYMYHVAVGDDIDAQSIRDGLDECFRRIHEFEEKAADEYKKEFGG